MLGKWFFFFCLNIVYSINFWCLWFADHSHDSPRGGGSSLCFVLKFGKGLQAAEQGSCCPPFPLAASTPSHSMDAACKEGLWRGSCWFAPFSNDNGDFGIMIHQQVLKGCTESQNMWSWKGSTQIFEIHLGVLQSWHPFMKDAEWLWWEKLGPTAVCCLSVLLQPGLVDKPGSLCFAVLQCTQSYRAVSLQNCCSLWIKYK